MISFLAQLDDGAAWLVAVVAGLGAIAWLARKARRAYLRVKPWVARARVVLKLAEYELQHNGGGSIKDSVSKIPALLLDVAILKEDVADLKDGAARLAVEAVVIAQNAADFRGELAAHVEQANDIHDEQAAAIAHLAEALPIIARSTPHADDADDGTTGP